MSAASANVQQRRSAARELSSPGIRLCQKQYDCAVAVNVWAFTAVAVPFVATPGASTAVVLRNSVSGGVRSGAVTAIGVNAASVGYGLLTAFGVSAAIQHWPAAWLVLRIGGATFLVWLGIRSLVRAFTYREGAVVQVAAAGPVSVARNLREGFVTNTLNPSIATFYLVGIPRFIPASAPFARSALLLAAVHVALALSWHLTWAAAGGTLAATLGRTRPRRLLEGATGIALLYLAFKLA
jgi:threonine/homoserine/homoserine lactone efflux protein